MRKPNKKCQCCGTAYYHCSSCQPHIGSWKRIYCSENCRDVFQTVLDYNTKDINKADAKKILSTLQILPSFREDIKAVVKTILGDQKETK